MSRFENEAALGPLWKNEQPYTPPFIDGLIAEQVAESESQHDLLSHSIHVRNLAYAIALRINEKFPNTVDADLVATASLGHDWGKIKQQPSINQPYEHAVRSHIDIANSGFPALASVAGRHNFGSLISEASIPLEQFILIYSDIRARTKIEDGQPVRHYKSLKDALPEIEGKLAESGIYSALEVEKGKNRIDLFEATLQKFGIDLQDISELPDGYSPQNRQFYNPVIGTQQTVWNYSSDLNTSLEDQEFGRELMSQGIFTLSREVEQKALQYRATVRKAVYGDEGAAEQLSLVDPARINQWLRILYKDHRRRVAKEYNGNYEDWRKIVFNRKLHNVVRANYIKAIGQISRESGSKVDIARALSDLKKIYLSIDDEDDVLFHAAQEYGSVLSSLTPQVIEATLDELWNEFVKSKPDSYSPVAIQSILRMYPEQAVKLVEKFKDVPLSGMGKRGLLLFAEALFQSKLMEQIDAVSLNSDGFRGAFILGTLLHLSESEEQSPNVRQVRIQSRAGLTNLYQITSDPILRQYILGLISDGSRHNQAIHSDTLKRLVSTTDDIEKIAYCAVIQKVYYAENKTSVSEAYNALINLIRTDPNIDVKLAALQALGRPGIAKQFTIDQMDDVMQQLWNIFYFDPQTRKLLPYFMASITTMRESYPKMQKDIERLESIIYKYDHPDAQLQYEALRFFIGIAGSLEHKDDPRLLIAQQNILRAQTISLEMFELIFQKYVSWLASSRYIRDGTTRIRNLVRKFICTPVRDPVVRYLTYLQLSGINFPLDRNDREIVFFAGTFDPIHDGALAVAETTSELVGDVYIQVDSGNPLKNPRPRGVRNHIAGTAIGDLPKVFLFNDPIPMDYRKPDDYAELMRVFPGKTVWLLVGQDRVSTPGSYYVEAGHYVFEVPHILTIREGNFTPPQMMEFRKGQIEGNINPELFRYIQGNQQLFNKIKMFKRIKVIGIPTNYSSTDIKGEIERGVLTHVSHQSKILIAQHYADNEFISHITIIDMIEQPGQLDLKREEDMLMEVSTSIFEEVYRSLIKENDLPPIDECKLYFDPITGLAYLTKMKGSRTERILETFNLFQTSLT